MKASTRNLVPDFTNTATVSVRGEPLGLSVRPRPWDEGLSSHKRIDRFAHRQAQGERFRYPIYEMKHLVCHHMFQREIQEREIQISSQKIPC
jgi:hypothetical protein